MEDIEEFGIIREVARKYLDDVKPGLYRISKEQTRLNYTYLLSYDESCKLTDVYRITTKHETKPLYKKQYILGAGLQGAVRCAIKEDGTIHAVKLINSEVEPPAIRNGAEMEAQILRDLERSPIKNIYHYKQKKDGDPKILILQNYFKSKTLEEVLDHLIKNLSEKEKVEFCLSLYLELKSIHEKGYVHNDLHQGNILVDIEVTPPVPYIIDFGSSTKGRKGSYHDNEALREICTKLVPNQSIPIFRDTKFDKDANGRFTDEVNAYIKMYKEKLENLTEVSKKPSPGF